MNAEPFSDGFDGRESHSDACPSDTTTTAMSVDMQSSAVPKSQDVTVLSNRKQLSDTNGGPNIRASKENPNLSESAGREREDDDDYDDVVDYLHLKWTTMASSFPLMAAALGPVSNLFSIIALVESWIFLLNDGQLAVFIKDPGWLLALNAVSLAFGVLANLSLLANFTGRVRYNLSQAVSIASFYFASMVLLALIAARYRGYLSLVKSGLDVRFSQGYWSAVITAVLYFLCAFVLTWNELGHLRGFYPASFILSPSQRSLMLQILCITIWLAGGGGVYSRIQGYSYGDAVYYCDVTILTIGLGDLHPTDDLSRALVLPYALIGIIILGLVVTNFRSLVISSSREKQALNRVERLRVRHLKRLDTDEFSRTDKESFDTMRHIHHSAKRRDMWSVFVGSVIVFCIFWLIGALVFAELEGWEYFHGIYFCSLALLTIGYGDFAPTQPGTRAFFVLWSLAAIPLMTILISSMCDTIIASLVYLTNKLGDLTLRNVSSESTADLSRMILRKMTNDLESRGQYKPPSDTSTRSRTLNRNDDLDNQEVDRELQLVDAIQRILTDLHENRNKKYSYEEWTMLAQTLDTQFDWLGPDSPIRFPVDEPALLLRLYWTSLREHLSNRRISQAGEPEQPSVEMEDDEIDEMADADLRGLRQSEVGDDFNDEPGYER
ncbi:hypothetical protein V1517DRAFT_325410 [Lipomyces orientalis]|uniref:Uncharacterized protein n=1 Tax=Lipomyces orientalis TaxID=1233043 RepID=A0ACC3TMA8_9ASCO